MQSGALGRVRVIAIVAVLAVGLWWLVAGTGSSQDALQSGTIEQPGEGGIAPGQQVEVPEAAAEALAEVALPEIEPDEAPDEVGLRSEVRHNGAGEAVTLDEAAGLACADLEVALAFAEDDPARSAEALESAIERAASSTVPGFERVAGLLRSVAVGNQERALTRDNVVEAFEACVAGGYEL